jgi:putative peptidoglycan lipid II flippase
LQVQEAVKLGGQWWIRWQSKSVNRRIFAAMITVGSLTAIVKLAAASKEVVIAYRFGVSDALDAFLIAWVLPQFVIELIGGSLNGALIPTYIYVREHEGQVAAQRLFSGVMVVSIVLTLAGLVLLALLSSLILPLLASGFNPGKLALTQQLYFLLLPTLLFCGIATIWRAILNAGERFALGAISPVVTPFLIVCLLVGVTDWDGIFVLTIATVVGLALEAGLLGWELRKRGFALMPWWYGATPAIRQVLRQYIPAVAASFLMGSTTLVAQSVAAMLGPGSVSILAYGSKVTTLLLGIGSGAVSTAVLPYFSRLVASGDSIGVRHTLKTYARIILLVTVPLTVILMYYSEPVVRLLLQRGAFTEGDTHLVGQVQAIFLVQVPLYILSMLCVRLISSFKASHLLLWGTIINLILSIVFNYLFAQWFQVAGIAFAISLMYLISTIYLLCAAIRLTGTLSKIPQTT